MLCTDGLSGLVANAAICKVLAAQSDPQAACDQLIQLALQQGGTDNVTVIDTATNSVVTTIPVGDAPDGDDAIVVSAGCPLTIERTAARLRGRLVVGAGQRCRLSLVASMAHDAVLRRVADDVVDERLEQTKLLEVAVGGAELSVAAGVARLGSACMTSRSIRLA